MALGVEPANVSWNEFYNENCCTEYEQLRRHSLPKGTMLPIMQFLGHCPSHALSVLTLPFVSPLGSVTRCRGQAHPGPADHATFHHMDIGKPSLPQQARRPACPVS